MRAFERCVVHLCMGLVLGAFAGEASGQAAAAASRVVGTVKSVSGSSVVVALDNGADSTVTFADSARIVRATPGQTDLKSALPIQVSDIQVGDRLSARVQPGDNNALVASSALVMAKSEIAQKQQREREEWRGGVGGLVKAVDASAGTITIPNSLAGAGKQIVIHVSAQTEIRRYSPDSVKFEDAKLSALDQIKVGDQVRARGTKNEDGSEFTAQAIVSGSFREMAATVVSTDAANNRVTVADLATKKPVTIKVGPDSMLRRLPQMMAMGIAMRLKGVNMPAGAAGGGAAAASAGAEENGGRANGAAGRWQGGGQQGGGQAWQRGNGAAGGPGGRGQAGFGGVRGGNGTPDFQQMLARMPAMQLTELNKGDAVLLVATEGSSGSGPTAITLLAGVEPILTAAPPGMNAAATVLSPWNLSTGGGGGDSAAGQ
ncbi:MAG TPA: DUF5666 domain-containing protein [Terriglobales bacterium]|nr:DUF5666 domain-containing protein [Terriglobales bacterium]